jgi:hypothetical protein
MTMDDSGRYLPATLYSKVHGAVRAKLEQTKAEADAAHQRALNTLQNELETMRDQLKEERDRRLVAEASLMENSNKLFQLESRLRDADEHEEFARSRSRVTEELERYDSRNCHDVALDDVVLDAAFDVVDTQLEERNRHACGAYSSRE